jgi:hypothetical protein
MAFTLTLVGAHKLSLEGVDATQRARDVDEDITISLKVVSTSISTSMTLIN